MVGLDISDRSIKVAEVTGSDPARLSTVCWSSLPLGAIRRGVIQDIPLVAAAVRDAFLKCSPVPVEGRAVIASIPEMRSFVRVLDLPVMSEEETEEAVHWAVRQHIPFDLDRVYLDWQVLPVIAQENRQAVLVGVAQRDVVDPLVEVLESVELEVMALELEAQAIVRSLLPRDAAGVQGVLIVDLGATSTNVIYFSDGAMRFTTSVQLGGDDLTYKLAQTLNLKPSVAAEQKAQVGIAGENANPQVVAALRDATKELVLRIDKTVREMGTQMQQENYVRTILLAGGAANLPGIQELFNEVFPNVPIQMGNPWTNILAPQGEGVPSLSLQDASHFATALGLALRKEDDV